MSNGHYVHEVNPYYLQARSEHRDLHAAIERIRSKLDGTCEVDASAASIAEIRLLITDLRDRLACHFRQEEKGGYLEEATIRLPQVAPQASALQRQHEELLAAANAMLYHAYSADAAPLVWSDLKADYTRFSKHVEAHEAAENALLSRAFNEDSGLDV
ncbi:MAG: hemerythrin domain-containing protein [Planctomycetia bacterium]|nr:hemerythrin domain-containing protein [Planctomycetia bacterium]